MKKLFIMTVVALSMVIVTSCGKEEVVEKNKEPITQKSYIYLELQKYPQDYVAFDKTKATPGTVEEFAFRYLKLLNAKDIDKDTIMSLSTEAFKKSLGKDGFWNYEVDFAKSFDLKGELKIEFIPYKKSKNKLRINFMQGEGNQRKLKDMIIIQRGNKLYLGDRFEKVD